MEARDMTNDDLLDALVSLTVEADEDDLDLATSCRRANAGIAELRAEVLARMAGDDYVNKSLLTSLLDLAVEISEQGGCSTINLRLIFSAQKARILSAMVKTAEPVLADPLPTEFLASEKDPTRKDINVLALVKGPERYVFLYDDESRAELLRVLGRFASRKVGENALSFTWYDAAVLSQKVRQESAKHHLNRRFSMPLPDDPSE